MSALAVVLAVTNVVAVVLLVLARRSKATEREEFRALLWLALRRADEVGPRSDVQLDAPERTELHAVGGAQ